MNTNGCLPPCRGYHETDTEQANRDDLTIEYMFSQRKLLGDDGFKQYLSEELA